MADATAARDVKRSPGDLITVPVDDGDTIYAGTIVMVNTAGYAVKGADTASCVFVGVAADTVNNASGSDGDKKVACYTEGTFEFAFSGTADQASVGKACYIVDNQTVALAATTSNDVLVGKIVEFIDASTVRVKVSLG